MSFAYAALLLSAHIARHHRGDWLAMRRLLLWAVAGNDAILQREARLVFGNLREPLIRSLCACVCTFNYDISVDLGNSAHCDVFDVPAHIAGRGVSVWICAPETESVKATFGAAA